MQMQCNEYAKTTGGDRIYAVYEASGTLFGELKYAAGKLVHGNSCALCDITHGWHPLGKKVWRMLSDDRPEIQWLYADQQSVALKSFTADRLPCVVLHQAGTFYLLLDRAQLKRCNGDLKHFMGSLEISLDAASTPSKKIET